MKTASSRFPIHDDLTAPEGSVPVLRGAMATGGQLPNFLGVLAGSPAALRGYARMRSELRRGLLPEPTLERIALAVAEHHHAKPQIAMRMRTARAAGLGIDEVSAARVWNSSDAREAAMLKFLQPLVAGDKKPPAWLKEEALELGWTEEELLEAIAFVALESFTAMINVAGDVPVDGSVEQARTLRAA
ncbi:MAG: carboxymuconolactone decarboxylase family protein [Solirubrobacteraceae bacterium]|nr:carboxymuconolactone decarboxylase family protein [Solirubrobacteraceae bacterium]